ncbi:MAG: hypothetical protein WCJ24_02660 [Candidatus Saccharibacteria bacterium]
MAPNPLVNTGGEQPVIPHYETGDRHLDRFQRIETLSRLDDGFLPTTLSEQTEVMGLQSVIDRPYGVAKHLAEVVIHQKAANTKDPLSAARKIVRNYIDYAADAQQRVGELDSLQTTLTDVNPELLLSRVVDASQPGILAFLRFFDLSALRDGFKDTKIGYDPQRVNYSLENGGIMVFADMAVNSWRVNQVRKRMPEATTNEQNRMSFWLERLVEVDKHYPVLKPVVKAGLDAIHARSS